METISIKSANNEIKVHAVDIAPALKGYKNEWVALSADRKRVVASSKSLKNVLDKAKNVGEFNPLVLKAPKDFGSYIL